MDNGLRVMMKEDEETDSYLQAEMGKTDCVLVYALIINYTGEPRISYSMGHRISDFFEEARFDIPCAVIFLHCNVKSVTKALGMMTTAAIQYFGQKVQY